MIKVQIVDGYGKGNKAKINGEGELTAVIHQHPPRDESELAVPFRQRLTDSGVASGDSDMTVNGSTTNQEFYVTASADFDIYIKSLSVIIGDGGSPALNLFGALSALTNGVEIRWDSQQEGNTVIHDGIKTNLEFIRMGFATGAVGTGTDAYLADVSGGGSEKSYIPQIDFTQQFGLPWGIRLRKGTEERIVFVVRDDLTGLTTFDAIAYGICF